MADPTPTIVTLTSDFGTSGSYVGAMKGSILTVNPAASLCDITHEVPAQNVAEAARILCEATPYFPTGTVHLVVVDPGVGTERAGVVLSAGGHVFVGPDNGVMVAAASAFGDVVAHRIENRALWRPEISTTFHGRDIFGPVAGALSAGTPLEQIGPRAHTLVRPPRQPAPAVTARTIEGAVITVDHFGNAITNIDSELLSSGGRILVAGRTIKGLTRTYGDAIPPAPIALIGSSGRLEIAIPNGSAASVLGLGPGARVVVEFFDS